MRKFWSVLETARTERPRLGLLSEANYLPNHDKNPGVNPRPPRSSNRAEDEKQNRLQ